MQLSRPGLTGAEAQRYATALNQIGREAQFDPLLAVAIVHFESRWFPERISDDREDYGLGQVRARYLAACRDDADPLNEPSEACVAARATLLDGVTNIKRMGSIISANKTLCKEKVGSDGDPQWLAGYQGYSEPEKNRWCKPGEKTTQVLDYYGDLLDRFHLRKKPVAKAPARPPVAVAKPAPASPPTAPKAPVAHKAPAKTPPKAAGKAPAPHGATASREGAPARAR